MAIKILVLGASGFIGRNIFESLESEPENSVFGTYHKNKFSNSPNLMQADLILREEVFRVMNYGWDHVIHCAAVTDGYLAVRKNPSKYITENIIMNTLVGEAVNSFRIPHMAFMSCTVLYPHNLDRPVTEDDTVYRVEDLHLKYFGGAWVKLSAENIYRYFSKIGSTKFSIVRHSNIYGRYDKFDLDRGHVLAATIVKAMTASEHITILGRGTEKRDFLYVDDLNWFIKRLLSACNRRSKSNFEVYNVGSGNSVTIDHMAKVIIGKSGKKLDVKYDLSGLTIDSKLVLDIKKAAFINWMPSFPLERGIESTINWYKASHQ